MTGETFRQIKLIFVMRNGAFKPQGSPCLKSGISGPSSGETFQTAHPVKKPAKKSKTTPWNLPLQTYSQVLSVCVIFDFSMWLTFVLQQADNYFDGIINRFQEIADNPQFYPKVDHIRTGYRCSLFGVHSAPAPPRMMIFFHVSMSLESVCRSEQVKFIMK